MKIFPEWVKINHLHSPPQEPGWWEQRVSHVWQSRCNGNSAMINLLLAFSYLQILDLMTTVAFLQTGVQEANPIVRMAFTIGHSPLGGLIAVKSGAVLLGFYCWWMGRERLLFRANLLFALLVVWNLTAVIGSHVR
jgi:hypothetical protein